MSLGLEQVWQYYDGLAWYARDRFDGEIETELSDRFVKQTNADRIRAMTDEELAEWFIKIQNDHVFAPDYPTMKNSWLDWLKQEVET